MDKKYKAIKTIKELDLSGRPSSSLSNLSGKSDFSNFSAEKRFNEAYAKDFSITPPKTPPKKPKKLSPLLQKTLQKPKSPPLPLEQPLQKPKSPLLPLEEPLQKPKKSKKKKMEFFLPPPLSFPKPIDELKDKITRDGSDVFIKYAINDPADIDSEWYFLINKNSPIDPKYKKKQLKLLAEDFSPSQYAANEVMGDPFGIYDDPKRLLKAKPLIDERLKRWLNRNDPTMPSKYSNEDMKPTQTTGGIDLDYFGTTSLDTRTLTPLTPPSAAKKRGRPLGSKNKPK